MSELGPVFARFSVTTGTTIDLIPCSVLLPTQVSFRVVATEGCRLVSFFSWVRGGLIFLLIQSSIENHYSSGQVFLSKTQSGTFALVLVRWLHCAA